MSRAVQRVGERMVVTVTLATVVAVTVLPLVWLFRMSVLPESLLTRVPPALAFRPTLAAYHVVLAQYPFLRSLTNSLIAAGASTAVAIVIGLPAAYAFTRFRFRGHGVVASTTMAFFVLPPIAMILPFYSIFSRLGLIDTRTALIVTYTGITLPVAIWILRGFVARVPVEIEEAAMVDGCSRVAALARVVVPIIAPGLAATAVLAFLYAWNDFIYAVILTSGRAATLPVMIAGFITDRTIYFDRIAATAMLVLVPPLLLGLGIQRYLAEGLSAGAVKE